MLNSNLVYNRKYRSKWNWVAYVDQISVLGHYDTSEKYTSIENVISSDFFESNLAYR